MTHDLVLVGGGLANGLLAYRLRQVRPEIDLVVLERGDRLGGNHTWSFHATDVGRAQLEWLGPLVARSWARYEVRFPAYKRTIDGDYHSVTSERFHDVVAERLGDRVRFGVSAADVGTGEVRLSDGNVIRGRTVIDGRGDPGSRALVLAYQKFVGQLVRLGGPHGLEGPVLMDATVEQRDGYRFVYTLPFGENAVLIEDTRYSDGPSLDREEIRGEIARYAASRDWHITSVAREEEGVLPIALSGDIEALWGEGPRGVARSGLRAGLFHPTTGYSLPDAVRLADRVAGLDELHDGAVFDLIRNLAIRKWRREGYFRMLNRMMFRAAEPERRYRILERFYRLPQPLIERFYSGALTRRDRFRILFGAPPVPIGRALRCIPEMKASPA